MEHCCCGWWSNNGAAQQQEPNFETVFMRERERTRSEKKKKEKKKRQNSLASALVSHNLLFANLTDLCAIESTSSSPNFACIWEWCLWVYACARLGLARVRSSLCEQSAMQRQQQQKQQMVLRRQRPWKWYKNNSVRCGCRGSHRQRASGRLDKWIRGSAAATARVWHLFAHTHPLSLLRLLSNVSGGLVCHPNSSHGPCARAHTQIWRQQCRQTTNLRLAKTVLSRSDVYLNWRYYDARRGHRFFHASSYSVFQGRWP